MTNTSGTPSPFTSPSATPMLACEAPFSSSAQPAHVATSLKMPLAVVAIEIVRDRSRWRRRRPRGRRRRSRRARTAKPNAERLVLEAGLARRVHEVPVAVVPEEMIGRALQPERPEGHHLDALPPSVRFAFSTSSIDCVDVGGDVDVEVAVAVRVEERRAGVPAGRLEAGLARDVRERAVALVSIEDVRAEAGHEDVRPAVAVESATNAPVPQRRRRRRPRGR